MKYIIVNVSDLSSINFDDVLQTDSGSLRMSVDRGKALLKYEGDMPSSLTAYVSGSIEYTYEEILNVMTGSDWWIEEPLGADSGEA